VSKLRRKKRKDCETKTDRHHTNGGVTALDLNEKVERKKDKSRLALGSPTKKWGRREKEGEMSRRKSGRTLKRPFTSIEAVKMLTEKKGKEKGFFAEAS